MSTEPVKTDTAATARTETAALFEEARGCFEPCIQQVFSGTEDEASVLLVPKGMQAIDVKPFLDSYRKWPSRITGTSQHQTLKSLTLHANEHKAPGSAAWASIDAGDKGVSASIVVVYDYHLGARALAAVADGLEGDDVGARHCSFGAAYSFPIAPEFQVWRAMSGKALSQAEMSAFLEDHLAEVCDAADPGQRTLDLAKLLETSVASASTLLGFARKSAATVNLFVSEKRDPATGAVELIYQEEVNHQNEDRARITPPGVFAVAVPVLQGGTVYRLPVRLKSAVAGRAIKWTLEVYRLDAAVQVAVEEELARFEAETGLLVYRGRYGAK